MSMRPAVSIAFLVAARFSGGCSSGEDIQVRAAAKPPYEPDRASMEGYEAAPADETAIVFKIRTTGHVDA
jgi:hypothetical protein